MAISYNTGTTATVNNSGTASGTVTIPAGVLNHDVILVLVMCFSTATGTLTNTLTSTATTPVAIGSQQLSSGASIQNQSGIWYIKAGASDASATLTYGTTGGTGGAYYYNVGLVAYTGANTVTPIDVNAGTEFFNAAGTGTTTTPSATTIASGDWQVQLLGVAPPNSNAFTVPGALTQRQAILAAANSGLLLEIADSNASVGAGGTAIGNTTWTCTPATNDVWSTSFTVGLAAPSTGLPYTGSHSPVRGRLPRGPYVQGNPGLTYSRVS